MSSTWRDRFRPIIASVLRENAGKQLREIRQVLRDAFPAGQREYHPYKIWLDEIRLQLGLKKDKRRKKGEAPSPKSMDGQGDLFT